MPVVSQIACHAQRLDAATRGRCRVATPTQRRDGWQTADRWNSQPVAETASASSAFSFFAIR
jgi:hypothetical protein